MFYLILRSTPNLLLPADVLSITPMEVTVAPMGPLRFAHRLPKEARRDLNIPIERRDSPLEERLKVLKRERSDLRRRYRYGDNFATDYRF